MKTKIHNQSPLITACFIVLLWSGLGMYGQSNYYSNKTRWVSVENQNGESRMEILTQWESKTSDPDIIFHWYDKGKLYTTSGAYAGYLLHGQFLRFHSNLSLLLEKGEMKNGKKTGTWTSWSTNGNITEITNWKKGLKHGATLGFDSTHNLKSKQNYKKGLLNGWQYLYEDGVELDKKKFKKGVLVEKQTFLGIKWRNPFQKNTEARRQKKPAKKVNARKKKPEPRKSNKDNPEDSENK